MRQGNAFLLVFALNDRSSFVEIKEFYEEIKRAHEDTDVTILLVGNKSDLVNHRQVTEAEAPELAKSFGCDYIETSARTRTNVVEEAFFNIVRTIRSKTRSTTNIKPTIKRKPRLGGCIICLKKNNDSLVQIRIPISKE
jgi:GTPase KRas protein